MNREVDIDLRLLMKKQTHSFWKHNFQIN